MKNLPEFSVIIPMYNEEKIIVETIRRVEEVLNQLPKWQLILVNDGSTDQTKETAERAIIGRNNIKIISYPRNQGRGYAMRQGFEQAAGEIIATIECDLSYDPKHLLALYQELCQNPEIDMVLGSVYMKGGRAINIPVMRLFLSRFGNKILAYSFGAKLSTLTSMLRAYRRHVLETLDLESRDKEIHLEIISKAMALNFNIGEIPATLTKRASGKSKFKYYKTISSHLFLSFFQRPMIIFGFFGILLLLLGLISAAYIFYLWWINKLNPNRPLIILSVLLILTGLQSLSFGFLALQQNFLRREIFRLQSKIKKNRT